MRGAELEGTEYSVGNASGKVRLEEVLKAAFARWHIEMWLKRAKQEAANTGKT